MYLSVISARYNELAVWAVGEAVHVIIVTLLLEDIALRLPLPDQQLTETGAAKGQPLTTGVDSYTADTLLGDAVG